MNTTLKYFLASAAMLLSSTVANAQTHPQLDWQRCYGGSYFDNSEGMAPPKDHMLVRTSDGYAFVAETESNDGDVSGNHPSLGNPSQDFWLVKTDLSGNLLWQKCFGGSYGDVPRCLIQTSDGGFVLCGFTESHDGDVTDPYPETITINSVTGAKAPKWEGWIIKTDSMGVKEWAHCIGAHTGDEIFNSVIEIPDGFLAVGYSSSQEEGWWSHGSADALVVKLSSKGKLQWHRQFGGSSSAGETANSVIPCPGGGYIFAGFAHSVDGDVTGWHASANPDAWVVRLDAAGLIVWEKCYGGIGDERAQCIMSVPAGYMVAGSTTSTDGDVIGNHGDQDGWVFTIDTNGALLSQRCFGGAGYDEINSVIRTEDGNYAFAGSTYSTDGDVSGLHHGAIDSADGWVGSFSPDLTLLWQECLGGTGNDGFGTVVETADHGFILNGSTESYNSGDVSGNHAGKGISVAANRVSDVWNAKLRDPAAKVESEITLAARHDLYPNPAQSEVYMDLEGTTPLRKIQFYSSLGMEVFPEYHTQGTTAVITVTDLPAGVYLARVTYANALLGTGEVRTIKLVKE